MLSRFNYLFIYFKYYLVYLLRQDIQHCEPFIIVQSWVILFWTYNIAISV